MHSNRWFSYFFNLCKANASMSKDPSTKVGAIIIRPDRTIASHGWNGFPMQCNDHSALYANREVKLSRVIHAEVNALLQLRERANQYTLCVWPLMPCDRCMTQIIQAGIKFVIMPPPSDDHMQRWGDSIKASIEMAKEANVRLVQYEPSKDR